MIEKMPRGEKATYESASKSFKAFLYRRSPDARTAYVERFVSDIKGMGTPGTSGRKRKTANTDGGEAPAATARAASPAPRKAVKAKGKSKKKVAKRKARPAPAEETEDAETEAEEATV